MRATVLAAALCAALGLGAAEPAAAGDRTTVAVSVDVQTVHTRSPRWYDQAPLAGTGPGLYYGYYPEHVPGYPVPIYRTDRPVYALRPVVLRVESSDGVSAHVRWCAAHYRSYRVGDDSFQPYDGPRQKCWSPFG